MYVLENSTQKCDFLIMCSKGGIKESSGSDHSKGFILYTLTYMFIPTPNRLSVCECVCVCVRACVSA